MKKIFIFLLFVVCTNTQAQTFNDTTKLGQVKSSARLTRWPNSTATRAGLDSTVRGATGIKTWTTGDIMYSNATNGITKLGIGSTGQLLTVASGLPAWSTYTGSTSVVTLGTVTTGTWSGTAIGTTKGGTNLTSYTTGDLPYASASNVLSKLGIGSSGQVLTVATGVPSWATPSGTPGGANTNIQFNNSSAFGGSSKLTWSDGNQELAVKPLMGDTIKIGYSNGLGDEEGLYSISGGDIATFDDATNFYYYAGGGIVATSSAQGFGNISAGSGDFSAALSITKGTVTQATSITTGVTLNKQSGVITTVSSTLGSQANATFTLTNSYITTASVINVTCQYDIAQGGIPNVILKSVSNGSCEITITNPAVLAGALDDILKIHFTVF